ncbi:LGFP repeat-containing protein [Corynebacterium freneyi]|uniref:LGFP repeat-containing protein n=1 Tax=Corynebacterium freneyi TaxID=134034 RepID=UPI001EF2FFA1|nr:hypothetical protein [Corynebacterium freneyi]MCG7438288.1 hypothetical protein [Corynebacterium freneyi]
MKSHKTRVSIAATALTLCFLGAQTPAAAAEFHGHWINGKILDAFNRLGGTAEFGNATTNELDAGRGGKFQVFQKNASIYWHPLVDNANAHQVKGNIRDKWGSLGWENGRLRYPTTDELPTDTNTGRYNDFEGGSIYWSPNSGANQIEGKIRERWYGLNRESGILGYPVTDETGTPDGVGKFNGFERGSIYWTPETGAHPVTGRIYDYWSNAGWENSTFGYPTSGEIAIRQDMRQNFQNGQIQWVAPNSSTLPNYESSWGSYVHVYNVFSPEPKRWSPESINAEVTQNFDKYFTFTGCGSILEVGAVCNLETVINRPAPIQVTAISATGFAFKSLEGHPEGAGRTITFNFSRQPSGGANDVRLHVFAWGPNSAVTATGPLNSETLARYSWSRFVQNIQSRINSSPTTFITSDNNAGAGTAQSRSQGINDTILPPEAEYIDPATVDTSHITNKVPLEPTSPTAEIEREAPSNTDTPAISEPSYRDPSPANSPDEEREVAGERAPDTLSGRPEDPLVSDTHPKDSK